MKLRDKFTLREYADALGISDKDAAGVLVQLRTLGYLRTKQRGLNLAYSWKAPVPRIHDALLLLDKQYTCVLCGLLHKEPS